MALCTGVAVHWYPKDLLRCARVLALSGGMDESGTVSEMGYVPAVAGAPDNCPDVLRPRPGGSDPDSVQLSGGVARQRLRGGGNLRLAWK